MRPGAGRSLLPPAADQLRAAFGQYASEAEWRWTVRIRALHVPAASELTAEPAVVRIDLSHKDARILAGLLRSAVGPAGEPGPRGPIEPWIGSGDAAGRVGVEASTIRGWVARHGPKMHPFPAPDAQYRGRNYWQQATIDEWTAEQRRLDEQHKAASARSRLR